MPLWPGDWVRHNREYINQINVFPVPDGDTGTNMALSLSATAAAVRDSEDPDISYISQVAAEASIMGAKGNSGMILAHWFQGLSLAFGSLAQVNPKELPRPWAGQPVPSMTPWRIRWKGPFLP